MSDTELHTVPAGIIDAILGNRGPNGELLERGRPALMVDAPANENDDDEA